MRGRFPPDLLAVVFAPVIVIVIAVGLGSLILHVAEFHGASVAYVAAASVVICLVAVLFFRQRRR